MDGIMADEEYTAEVVENHKADRKKWIGFLVNTKRTGKNNGR